MYFGALEPAPVETETRPRPVGRLAHQIPARCKVPGCVRPVDPALTSRSARATPSQAKPRAATALNEERIEVLTEVLIELFPSA